MADEILEIFADSLTSYLAPATGIQGVRPRHSQRGVNLDGSARAGGMFGLALEGNPFEPSLPGRETLNGVRLATGAFVPTYVDIALPSTGITFVIGRSYNARQESGGSHHDSQGVQGVNWHQSSMPEIAFYDHPSDASKDVIYLVGRADSFVEFQRAGSSSLEFKATNGAAGMM